MTSVDVELVLDQQALLGEGPVWFAQLECLIWVDITKGLLHLSNIENRSDETFDLGQPVGAVAPTRDRGAVVAVRDGFGVFDFETGKLTMVAEVERDNPNTRMNDGKCDAGGRFWAGTMAFDMATGMGSLYRLDADYSVHRMLREVAIANGIAWSHDRRTMYFIDSARYCIDQFDFEESNGTITSRRTLVSFPRTFGLPDGMTIDREGFLWVAFFDGGSVRRYSNEGELVSSIYLPVSKVTSCCFGGTDLGDLFITSASQGLSASQRAAEPLAGAVFRARPGVCGLMPDTFSD